MRRIACINQKGGVGKTTTTVQLGAAVAETGRRVLLIDLDPQAHLSLHLGLDPDSCRPGMYEVLTDGLPVREALREITPKLSVLPAHTDLAAAEMELVSVVGREVLLRDALQAIDDEFDLMLVDCPPSLGVLTINALAAVDEIIVPMQAHFLSLQGFAKLLDTVRLVSERINGRLHVSGVVICLFDAGTRLAAEVMADLDRFLQDQRELDRPWSSAKLFGTVIRRNIKLAECASMGRTIFDYAPASHGANDYRDLADELLGTIRITTADAVDPAGKTAVPTVVGVLADRAAGRDRPEVITRIA